VLLLAAMLSMSLGWMNLLPIPPLDGGRVLIELVQLVIRRPVPVRVQNALSLVGMALFMMLFVYMVMQDATRLGAGLL
jgi:regulator of sigma E protease